MSGFESQDEAETGMALPTGLIESLRRVAGHAEVVSLDDVILLRGDWPDETADDLAVATNRLVVVLPRDGTLETQPRELLEEIARSIGWRPPGPEGDLEGGITE